MKKKSIVFILALIIATMLFPSGNINLISAQEGPAVLFAGAGPFTDIQDSDWFYESVIYVDRYGLMKGISGSSFGPGLAVTRAMTAEIFYRIEGEPEVTGASGLSDVLPGRWYADAVTWAVQNNIIKGYTNGEFGINDPVSREWLADAFYRYAVYKNYDVSVGLDTNILSYIDAFEIAEYAIPAIQWAAGAGLIQGYNGNMRPQAEATRKELAAILYKFIVKVDTQPVVNNDAQYGFRFTLPKSWGGYSVVDGSWEGRALTGPQAGNATETGRIVTFRHPEWTADVPRQDIPVMVFTIAQWNAVINEELGVGAAPIPPSELGRNSVYVFALPARYNFGFLPGYEEVEDILADNPLHPTEKISHIDP